MPPTATTLLLAQLSQIREQLEGITDPDRLRALARLKELRELLEGIEAREQDEQRRATRGIGAAPRFGRLR